MAEYINKQDVLNAFEEADCDVRESFADEYCEFGFSLPLVRSVIEKLPAADVRPVVHGRWLKHYRSGITVAEGCVSSCCDMWNERETRCCPVCGAKMQEA